MNKKCDGLDGEKGARGERG